jgi:hypothetical protein
MFRNLERAARRGAAIYFAGTVLLAFYADAIARIRREVST